MATSPGGTSTGRSAPQESPESVGNGGSGEDYARDPGRTRLSQACVRGPESLGAADPGVSTVAARRCLLGYGGAMVRMLMIGILLWAGARAQQLPTGFTSEAVVGGFARPTGLAELPDGRMLVCEQWTGAVKVVADGAVGTVGAVTGMATGFSQGLLSIAVDPGWPARPYLYLWYDHASPQRTRLVMWQVGGDLSVGASANLVQVASWDVFEMPDNSAMHNGGCVRFGPDGSLFLTTGDDTQCCLAQNVDSPLGKVLRMSVANLPPTGPGLPSLASLEPPGNPFTGPTAMARLVWAVGLRNPFRMNIDSATGRVFVTDVGETQWEDVHVAVAGGANFGWPFYEGGVTLTQSVATCAGTNPAVSCGPPPAAVAAPVHAESHAGGALSMIGMGVCRAPQGAPWAFGAGYEGDYFFVDHYNGRLRRIRFDGTTWVVPPPVPGQAFPWTNTWGHGVFRVSDAAFAADGALYWLSYPSTGSGALNRIRPDGRILTIVSGNGQRGNAETPLPSPLVVRVLDANGAAAAGVPVTFAVTAGSGVLSAQTVLADAGGNAMTSLTPTLPAGDVQVTATAPGAASVVFDVVWRGLELSLSPPSTATLSLTHSETSSPFTVVVDAAPATWFATTPWGNVWTSVLTPSPGLFLLDGLGLVTPPDPSYLTGPTTPTWTMTFPTPVLGGVPLVVQAYAVDQSVFGQPDAVLVSNAVFFNL